MYFTEMKKPSEKWAADSSTGIDKLVSMPAQDLYNEIKKVEFDTYEFCSAGRPLAEPEMVRRKFNRGEADFTVPYIGSINVQMSDGMQGWLKQQSGERGFKFKESHLYSMKYAILEYIGSRLEDWLEAEFISCDAAENFRSGLKFFRADMESKYFASPCTVYLPDDTYFTSCGVVPHWYPKEVEKFIESPDPHKEKAVERIDFSSYFWA